MCIEHHGTVVSHLIPRITNLLNNCLNLGRRTRKILGAARSRLNRLWTWIHPYLVPTRTAQQAIHRNPVQLATDIPQRHINRGNRMNHQTAVADIAMCAEHPLPEVLRTRGILSNNQFGKRLCKRASHPGIHIIDLTPASNPGIRLDLDISLHPNRYRSQPRNANTRCSVLVIIAHTVPPTDRI